MVGFFGSEEWSEKTLQAIVPLYHGGVTIPWSANDGYVTRDVPVPTKIVEWYKNGQIWVVNSYIKWSLGTQPWTGVEIKVNGITVAKLDNTCIECSTGKTDYGTTAFWDWTFRPNIHVEVHGWKHGALKLGQGATVDADADLIIEYKVPKGQEQKYTYWQTTPEQQLLEYAKWGFISALGVSGTLIIIKIIKLIRGRK